MKITRVETIFVRLPLAFRYAGGATIAAAGAAHQCSGSVLIKLHTDEGPVGLGDVIVKSGEAGEGAAVRRYLESALAPLLLGADPRDRQRLIDRLWAANLHQSSVYVAGLDIALHDLAGKLLGVPLYQLLGGKVRERVALTWNVPADRDLDLMARQAAEAVAQGFRHVIKVKTGTPWDVEALARVQAAAGEVPLRPDDNGAFLAGDAIDRFRRARERGARFELLEQPAPNHDLAGLRRVAEALGERVMYHVGYVERPVAAELLRRRVADAVSVPVFRHGVREAVQLMRAFELVGVGCAMGSGLESPVAATAAIHVATAVRNCCYPVDTLGPLWFAEELLAAPPSFGAGYAVAPAYVAAGNGNSGAGRAGAGHRAGRAAGGEAAAGVTGAGRCGRGRRVGRHRSEPLLHLAVGDAVALAGVEALGHGVVGEDVQGEAAHAARPQLLLQQLQGARPVAATAIGRQHLDVVDEGALPPVGVRDPEPADRLVAFLDHPEVVAGGAQAEGEQGPELLLGGDALLVEGRVEVAGALLGVVVHVMGMELLVLRLGHGAQPRHPSSSLARAGTGPGRAGSGYGTVGRTPTGGGGPPSVSLRSPPSPLTGGRAPGQATREAPSEGQGRRGAGACWIATCRIGPAAYGRGEPYQGLLSTRGGRIGAPPDGARCEERGGDAGAMAAGARPGSGDRVPGRAGRVRGPGQRGRGGRGDVVRQHGRRD